MRILWTISFCGHCPDFINNPCVAGFMVELALLSAIVRNGLHIERMPIKSGMKLIMFDDEYPTIKTEITGRPVLYCPKKYNYRIIDGLVVWVEPIGKKKTKEK